MVTFFFINNGCLFSLHIDETYYNGICFIKQVYNHNYKHACRILYGSPDCDINLVGDWSEIESQLTGSPWTESPENPTKLRSSSPNLADSSQTKVRRLNSRPRSTVHREPSSCGRLMAWYFPMTPNTRYKISVPCGKLLSPKKCLNSGRDNPLM